MIREVDEYRIFLESGEARELTDFINEISVSSFRWGVRFEVWTCEVSADTKNE